MPDDTTPRERIEAVFKSPYNTEGEVLSALIGAIAAEMQEFEDTLADIERNKFIDTADEAQLEQLGSLFEIERQTGESADSFRSRLKVALRGQITSATTQEIIEVVATLTGLDEEDIGIREPFDDVPAEIQLVGIEDVVADIDMTDGEFVGIVENVVAAGIGIGILLEFEFEEPILLTDTETVQIDVTDVAHEASSDPEDGRTNIDVNSVLEPLFGDSVTATTVSGEREATRTDDVHRVTLNVDSPKNVDVWGVDKTIAETWLEANYPEVDFDYEPPPKRDVPTASTESDVTKTTDVRSDADVHEVTLALGNIGRGQIDVSHDPNLESDWEPEDGGTHVSETATADENTTRADEVSVARIGSDDDPESTYNIDVHNLLGADAETEPVEETTVTGDAVTELIDDVLVATGSAGLGQIDTSYYPDGERRLLDIEEASGESGVSTADSESVQTDAVESAVYASPEADRAGRFDIDVVQDVVTAIAEGVATQSVADLTDSVVEEVQVSSVGAGRGNIDLTDDGETGVADFSPEEGGTERSTATPTDTVATSETETVGSSVYGASRFDTSLVYSTDEDIVGELDISDAEASTESILAEAISTVIDAVEAAYADEARVGVDVNSVTDDLAETVSEESMMLSAVAAVQPDTPKVAYIGSERFSINVFQLVEPAAGSDNLEVSTATVVETTDVAEVETAYADEARVNIDVSG